MWSDCALHRGVGHLLPMLDSDRSLALDKESDGGGALYLHTPKARMPDRSRDDGRWGLTVYGGGGGSLDRHASPF